VQFTGCGTGESSSGEDIAFDFNAKCAFSIFNIRKESQIVEKNILTNILPEALTGLPFSKIVSWPISRILTLAVIILQRFCKWLVFFLQVCSGDQFANLERTVLHTFVQLRADYRSARLAKHFS